MMTIEEAKKMEGTEFIFVYEDGDEIKAYVKKFDPKIGLTCMSLETESRDGWKGNPETQHEDDGTFCVIGHDFKNGSLNRALFTLDKIKSTGRFKPYISRGGGVQCSFR